MPESPMDLHTVMRPILSTLYQIPPFPGWDLPRPKDEKPVSAQMAGVYQVDSDWLASPPTAVIPESQGKLIWFHQVLWAFE